MRLLAEVLEESGRSLEEVAFFAADLGPGSFTGVKVAVTIAKTMAFAQGARCLGADSFDLISHEETVVLPSKRGEWFVRVPDEPLVSNTAAAAPRRQSELPEGDFKGYGPGIEVQVFPSAARFAAIFSRLEPIEPQLLVPNYLIEPSISQPKASLSPLGDRRA